MLLNVSLPYEKFPTNVYIDLLGIIVFTYFQDS